MSVEFKTYLLSEITSKITKGTTPSKKDGGFSESGINYIKAESVGFDGRIDRSKFAFISEDVHNKLKRSQLEVNDILFSMAGIHLGKVALVEEQHVPANTNQALALIRPINSLVNPLYLLYFLQQREVVHFVNNATSQSAQPNINLKQIGDLEIRLPELAVQNKVVDILSSLDRKLVINTDINQNLESIAQAIFKSWFVDFDPVKAKMNGEQPEGMDAATASLFPDKLDSETGIPDGWTQGSIADIAKLNAKSWTKKNSPEQVHYVDLANTKNGVIESVTTYDFEESPSRARRILNSGDTIVGTVRPGNRSYAFIGDTEKPLTGSTGFAVLSPKKSYWTSFVYLATTNDDSIDEYARLADGGAYPAIKPTVVADTQCAIPTEDIAKKFWELTGPMLRKAHQNRLQNEYLAALRDTLLPKLLSGEIELGTSEELVEAI
ncbi:restriction endonuclease subunit S [Vibrio fluvialis]